MLPSAALVITIIAAFADSTIARVTAINSVCVSHAFVSFIVCNVLLFWPLILTPWNVICLGLNNIYGRNLFIACNTCIFNTYLYSAVL